VADKLMVAAALIVLTEFGRIYALVALIIIGREITISALREWMAQIGQSKSVAVNMAGKVKTVAQLVAIPFLLFDDVLFGLFHTRPVGHVLIWIAAFITLWSMVVYLKAAMVTPEPPKSAPEQTGTDAVDSSR
jgi:CDP-diacylglycerol--glycerol-3-phosphate 3-phosphatidyltransferase/cardiolipin synthase